MKAKKSVTLGLATCLALILVMLLFMPACPKPSPGEVEVIELKLNESNPPDGLHSGIYGPWIDAVYERSQGKIEIVPYYMNQLSPPDQVYDSVVRGIADVGSVYIAMTPGRFPCLEMMEAAKVNTLCDHPSRAAWELYETFPEMQEEFADTKVLAIFAMRPYPPGAVNVGTARKPVRSLEDMQGLKIEAPGVWVGAKAHALGASPMKVFIGDVYEQLEKGVLDGCMLDPGQLDELKLRDVINYITPVCFGFIPFFVSMNLDTWNSLPPDAQEVFEETGGEFFADIADAYGRPSAQAAIDRAVSEHGLEVIELPPEEVARWIEATASVQDEYAAELEAKGIPGREMLDLADQLFAKYRD